MMFKKKTRISQYVCQKPSPRISPKTNISNIELINESTRLRKKIRYTIMAISGGSVIALLLTLAIVIPSIMTAKSVTTAAESTTLTTVVSSMVSAFSSSTTVSITSTMNIITSDSRVTTEKPTSIMQTTEETTESFTTMSTTPFYFRWNTTGETVAGLSSLSGTAANRLKSPTRITIDSFDTLYIADTDNSRIQKYVFNATFGTTVAGQSNGSPGSSATYLKYGEDVAVDSNGNVYACDTSNHRVQLWNINVSSGVSVVGNGTIGNAINLMKYPRALTMDLNTGSLYIADRDNNRILRYLTNTSAISIAAGGAGFGKQRHVLYGPIGVAFDRTTNSLIIINAISHTVVRWKLGATNWTMIAGNENGTAGNSASEVNSASDVTVDEVGNIYVADTGNHRVQFFPVNQTVGITIAGINGVPGNSSTLFNNPFSIALDSHHNLYVSDKNNHRIQRFNHY